MVSLNLIAPEYRYFVTDLLSNTLLAEIPFRDVTYERALKGAGAFSGKIAIIPKANPALNPLDVYESTMPGKTGLYVMRDGICVWGGIIWSREYNLVSRELNVSASEFTSYFHHRHVWKTWTHTYGATLVVNNEVGNLTFDPGFAYLNTAGGAVKVAFHDVGNFKYDGFYTVLASPAPTETTFAIDAIGVPNGTYPLTTVYVRTDTYDWVRSLINETMTDFTGLDFATDEIEPGHSVKWTVTNKQLGSGYAVLTTSEPHDVTPGQVVIIRNVDPTFDGQYIVESIPNATQIRYALDGTVASTPVSVNTKSVTARSLTNYLATLTLPAGHGFRVGQHVTISGVDPSTSITEIMNGEYVVLSVTATSISYLTGGVVNVPYTAVTGGTVVATPHVLSGEYGSFSANSDIQIDFSTDAYSGVDLEPETWRGFELRNVGVELDKYSDRLPTTKRKRRTTNKQLDRANGFEYRVDCEYDPNTASFKRIFVLLPINFPDPPAAGEVSPLSRFGADQLVFEYPGNIADIQISEKSDQSATRFWMQGNLGDLGADAAQPYAAASSKELLVNGWPLLDLEHTEQDVGDEQTLYEYALRYLSESRPPTADITVSVNGSIAPVVGEYSPGDWCALILDDEFVRMRLASDLEPRDTAIVRKIDSYSVSVPNSPTFPEKVSLKLIAEWEIDKKGATA